MSNALSSGWRYVSTELFPPIDQALREFFVGPPPPPAVTEPAWTMVTPNTFNTPTLGGGTASPQDVLPHPIGEFFMTPLQYPLDAIGLGIHHPILFYFALVASFGLWCLILRIAWTIPARWLGIYNPNHYRLFPRLPWRLLYAPFDMLRDYFNLRHLGKKATARLAGPVEVAAHLYKPGKTLLGRMMAFNLPGLMPVGIKVQRHLMMVADTGGGKTTTLTSILALHRGNAFVIDPNGQIAHGLRERCGSGGNGIIGKKRKVAILDPKNQVAGVPTAAWNPFEELHAVAKSSGEAMVQDVAWKMAQALIVTDSQRESYWSDAARQFSYALILYMYTHEPRETQTLMRWRDLLCNGLTPPSAEKFAAVAKDAAPGDVPLPRPYEWLLHCMESSSKFQNAIRNATGPVREALKIDREGQLTSSAKVQTTWVDFENVEAILGRSDFSFEELKTGDLTLFVCAPLTDVRSTMTAWFRLLTVMALDTFERLPGRPNPPTLLLIDELPALGHLEALATAPVTLRKYGGRLLGVTQDIGMLKETYSGTWESFLSSADAIYWMNIDHSESVAYLLAKLGERTRRTKVRDPGGGRRIHLEDRPLMNSKEIVQYVSPKRGRMLVTVKENTAAFRLKVPHYFRELPVYYYQSDPNEDESLLRSLTRSVFRFFSLTVNGSRPITEIETAARVFENQEVAWHWLEDKFDDVHGTVSISAFFFERVNAQQPLGPGTVFDISGSAGTQRQARLDAWDSYDGHALLTFLNEENTPRLTHEYKIISDDIGTTRLSVEIKYYRRLGFFDLLVYMTIRLASLVGNKNVSAKCDLGLPPDYKEPESPIHMARKTRCADFGHAALETITPVAEPVRIRTPRGTFVNNQDGTVTHIDSGLIFMGAPWGMQYKDGRFTGNPTRLEVKAAKKYFGSGPWVRLVGQWTAPSDQVPGTNREHFKPGKVRVTFGGHSDWRLATAPELALLGMSAGWTPSETNAEDARQARKTLFPDLAERVGMLWSASGGDFCLEMGDHWTIGENDNFGACCEVLLVRKDPQAALNAATFMDSAIAIPRMPDRLLDVLRHKHKNLRGQWRVSENDTVVAGQAVLSYGEVDVFTPVAGRIIAIGSCDPASSWDAGRGWPNEEHFLFSIQPIDGSRLSGTVPRAWAQLIAWCDDVLGSQPSRRRTIPEAEAAKEELRLLQQAEHRAFQEDAPLAAASTIQQTPVAPLTATDFWDAFDKCFHPDSGSFPDIKGREKITGLIQRPETEVRSYNQLRSLLRTICTRNDPLLHQVWNYADQNIAEQRAG